MNACEWRVTTPVIVIHFLIHPCHFNDSDHESAYGSNSWDVIKSWVRVTSFFFVVFLSSLAISRIHYSMVHSRCLSIAIPLSLTPNSFASSQHSSNIHTITFFSVERITRSSSSFEFVGNVVLLFQLLPFIGGVGVSSLKSENGCKLFMSSKWNFIYF